METFEIIAKKRQKKWTKKTIGLSLMVTSLVVTLVFLGQMGLEFLANRNYHKLIDYYYQRSLIAYPNIDLGSSTMVVENRFGGRFYAYTQKDLAGVKIPYEDLEAQYSPFSYGLDHKLSWFRPASPVQDSTQMAFSTKEHIKVPLFFNPQAEYGPEDVIRQEAQELHHLAEMDQQLVEVALSFDKLYTYEEIKGLLPQGLKINFVWIGSQSQLNPSALPLHSIIGWTPRQAYLEPSFREFYEVLEKLYKDGEFKQGRSDDLEKDVAAYLENTQGEMTKAQYGGVIVSGPAENFADLQGADWIFASSIGASTLNQPYYDLEKE